MFNSQIVLSAGCGERGSTENCAVPLGECQLLAYSEKCETTGASSVLLAKYPYIFTVWYVSVWTEAMFAV